MSDLDNAAPATPSAATDNSRPAPEMPGHPNPENTPEQVPKAGINTPLDQVPKPQAQELPEKYELKIPEGSLLNPARVTQIETYAKEHKLTQEQAQSLLEREHSALSEYVEMQQAELQKKSTEWIEQIKADPEIGGAQFTENVEYAKRALKAFADPEFIADLDKTGLGNHPGLVKAFARIGKAQANDKFVLSNVEGAQDSRSVADILYSNKTT